MKKAVLTEGQVLFLKLFAENNTLSSRFYLTGGTALVAYYIPYRFSEDLDFFSEKEIDTAAITVFLRSVKDRLGYKTFDFNTSYNRNIFFINLKESILKTEFTFFPFSPIEAAKNYGSIKVDSVLDIAVNKLFTIYQNPRSRDFMDLYMIQKKYNFSVDDLLEKAKIKFDWHVDKLKLGAQFLLAQELKDFPKLRIPLAQIDWQNYFKNQAKKLAGAIIK